MNNFSELVWCAVIQSPNHVWLFVTPWTAAHQAFLSFTISLSLLKLMSIELVMLTNHLKLCHTRFLVPSIFPWIRVFSNELALHTRWPKFWSFSISISTSNKYSELNSFRMDWLDLLAVQGTLRSLVQHHNSKASSLWHSTFGTQPSSHICTQLLSDNNSIIQSPSQQHYYKVGLSIIIPLWQMRKLSYVAIARLWCRSWLQSCALDHYATCLMNTGMPCEMILLGK